MSGVFRPEQNVTIEATDDKALADAHGLTEWDAERGQYVAPAADEAEPGEDDGAHLDPSETDQERYDREHDELQQQGDEGA